MDHFAKIFICYQKLGKADKPEGGAIGKPILLFFRFSYQYQRPLNSRKNWLPGVNTMLEGGCELTVMAIHLPLSGWYAVEKTFHSSNCFPFRCIGVFDTVGSLGVPESLTLRSKVRQLFGFKDTVLGEHIERAYQALALHEMRADFVCNDSIFGSCPNDGYRIATSSSRQRKGG